MVKTALLRNLSIVACGE